MFKFYGRYAIVARAASSLSDQRMGTNCKRIKRPRVRLGYIQDISGCWPSPPSTRWPLPTRNGFWLAIFNYTTEDPKQSKARQSNSGGDPRQRETKGDKGRRGAQQPGKATHMKGDKGRQRETKGDRRQGETRGDKGRQRETKGDKEPRNPTTVLRMSAILK